MATNASDGIKKREKDIQGVIQKKDWKSGVSRVDYDASAAPVVFKDQVEWMAMPGAAPWVMGLRLSAWRCSASDIPLLGFGAVVRAHAEDLLVCGLDAAPLLGQGLSLNDIQAFLESPSGGEYARESTHMTILRAGHCMWMPYGLIPALSFVNSKAQAPMSKGCSGDPKTSRWMPRACINRGMPRACRGMGFSPSPPPTPQSQTKAGHIAFATFQHIFSVEACDAIQANAFVGIKAWTEKFLATVRSTKVFTHRCALMDSFVKAVGESQAGAGGSGSG